MKLTLDLQVASDLMLVDIRGCRDRINVGIRVI